MVAGAKIDENDVIENSHSSFSQGIMSLSSVFEASGKNNPLKPRNEIE